MADEKSDQPQDLASSKKKSPILVIAIVAGLMVVEGAGVALFMAMSGAPSQAGAAGIAGTDEADGEALQEVELFRGRFQNLATGRVWDWEVEIFLKVREKYVDKVRSTMERRKAEINEGLARIFRKSQHNQLKEPGLQTISRQVTAYMLEVFGADPADGVPYVERVLLPKCDGYPADF
ncbi:MAG: hypothetical protein H6811_09385 [Phycisphaeraceae bacterium]|nr:hypothetical protein [Phycisphaeraceae bacterium]